MLRQNPWPVPMNGKQYTNPEVAALLCQLEGTYGRTYGLKGDYLQRARGLGYISKHDKHYYHAAQTYAREPSAVRHCRGKPSYVERGSLSAPTVAGGGPTSDFKGCEIAVNKAKDDYYAARGITGKGPACKNTVSSQSAMSARRARVSGPRSLARPSVLRPTVRAPGRTSPRHCCHFIAVCCVVCTMDLLLFISLVSTSGPCCAGANCVR